METRVNFKHFVNGCSTDEEPSSTDSTPSLKNISDLSKAKKPVKLEGRTVTAATMGNFCNCISCV